MIAFITDRVIEPRLGPYKPEERRGRGAEQGAELSEAESRGLRYALFGLIGADRRLLLC